MNPAIFPFYSGEDTMLLYQPIDYLLGKNPLASTIMSLLFIILLAFQTLHMLLQDWLDLFPLNDIKQMSQELPLKTKMLVTLGNVTPSIDHRARVGRDLSGSLN